MGRRPGQNKHPDKTSAPEYAEVVDVATFWRNVRADADKNGFSVIFGFAGGPLVVYGNRGCAPHAGDPNSPFVDREGLAQILGCHPDTVSRKKKELEAGGVIGKRIIGSGMQWRKDAAIAFAESKGLTGKRKPGRPRKNF